MSVTRPRPTLFKPSHLGHSCRTVACRCGLRMNDHDGVCVGAVSERAGVYRTGSRDWRVCVTVVGLVVVVVVVVVRSCDARQLSCPPSAYIHSRQLLAGRRQCLPVCRRPAGVYGWLGPRQRRHTSNWPDNRAGLEKRIAPDMHQPSSLPPPPLLPLSRVNYSRELFTIFSCGQFHFLSYRTAASPGQAALSKDLPEEKLGTQLQYNFQKHARVHLVNSSED